LTLIPAGQLVAARDEVSGPSIAIDLTATRCKV
jgi:hypothetical protein